MIFSRNRGSPQFLEALPPHSAHNHRLLLGPYSGFPMLPHLGTPEQPAGPPTDDPAPQDIHAKSPNEKRPLLIPKFCSPFHRSACCLWNCAQNLVMSIINQWISPLLFGEPTFAFSFAPRPTFPDGREGQEAGIREQRTKGIEEKESTTIIVDLKELK